MLASFDLCLDFGLSINPHLLFHKHPPLFCVVQQKINTPRRIRKGKAKMVSIRFTSFLVVLMFITQDSAADIHQVTEKIMFAAGNGFTVGGGNPSAIGKDIVDVVPTPPDARDGKIGGRKMMKRRVLMKEIVKDRVNIITEEASKISGAAHKRKCSHKGKRKLNIECKMSGRGSIHHHMRRVEMSSFVALNADYHAPKSHPPKNN